MARLLAILLLFAASASAATISDDLVIFTTQIRKPDTGTASTFQASVKNVSGVTLPVDLVLKLHGNATISAASNEVFTCAQETPQRVRCHAGVPLQHDGTYAVPVTISQVDERRLPLARD